MIGAVLGAHREGGFAEVLWRLRKKAGLIRRLQMRYRLGRTITSAYGVRLACNFGDITFGMYVRGSYGRYYWDHLSRYPDPFVFVDIGANQGLYTLCAARNRANLACHAFEPNEGTFRLLQENIRLNGVEGKCRAYDLAISSETGAADLRVNPHHSGGASLAQMNGSFGTDSASLPIRTINHREFDHLLGEGTAPILVKVDVEGFEPTVLAELVQSRHAGRIAEIFYEVDEAWVDPAALRGLLEQAGFTTFDRIGEGRHYDIRASRPR